MGAAAPPNQTPRFRLLTNKPPAANNAPVTKLSGRLFSVCAFYYLIFYRCRFENKHQNIELPKNRPSFLCGRLNIRL